MKQFSFLLIVSGLFLGACNPIVTKQEFAPKMYDEKPLSILVLPPINKSTAAEAKEYYSTTVAEPLTNCGYYVMPYEVVVDILNQEGLSDTEAMFDVPPSKFKEFFGIDAVMYVTILSWNSQYLITSGSVTVQIAANLKSTTTNETIWFYDDMISVNTSGDDGGAGGMAGLLVKAITTAVKTAATDYVPIARKVNESMFLAMPYGKYHKDYGTDRDKKIEGKQKKKEAY